MEIPPSPHYRSDTSAAHRLPLLRILKDRRIRRGWPCFSLFPFNSPHLLPHLISPRKPLPSLCLYSSVQYPPSHQMLSHPTQPDSAPGHFKSSKAPARDPRDIDSTASLTEMVGKGRKGVEESLNRTHPPPRRISSHRVGLWVESWRIASVRLPKLHFILTSHQVDIISNLTVFLG